MDEATKPLTDEQKYALIDILTHDRTYREIEEFKSSKAIQNYGPPFQDNLEPSTPILQRLVTTCALTLPGLRDVTPDFWKVHVQTLLAALSDADLSESYDKGSLGIRKTLATAISSIIEYPTRGMLGGFPKDSTAFADREYDPKNANDVLLAWQHFIQRLVYTDYFDKLYKRASETDKLSDHDSLLQSAHEFIIVNLASFMHYTLILSPEGPGVVRMIDSVNKLAPYTLIRQTLRVGNVATMINGMMKLMLAKMSIGSLTNWIGMSSGADEGQNLLQQIMSTILGWDKRDFKKRLDKLEKDENAPSQEVRDALTSWIEEKTQREHQQTRDVSKQNKMSIVQTILAVSSTDAEMSEEQHSLALEYLSLKLSIRDRTQITNVLCHSNPDHLTQAIRDGVAAYEPIIRQVHQAVDLSDTVSDFQAFVHDMLKLCKSCKPGAGSEDAVPDVEDFVHLLHKHQNSCHKFLHQVTKNGPELSEWFREWCHGVAANFQRPEPTKSDSLPVADRMAAIFMELPEMYYKEPIRQELTYYAEYLKKIHEGSAARIREVIQHDISSQQYDSPAPSPTKSTHHRLESPIPSPIALIHRRHESPAQSPTRSTHNNSRLAQSSRRTMYGPGAYLAKWQALLDTTEITPDKAFGPLRHGADISVRRESVKDVDGEVPDTAIGAEAQKESAVPTSPPDVVVTLKVLGPKFKEMLTREDLPKEK